MRQASSSRDEQRERGICFWFVRWASIAARQGIAVPQRNTTTQGGFVIFRAASRRCKQVHYSSHAAQMCMRPAAHLAFALHSFASTAARDALSSAHPLCRYQ